MITRDFPPGTPVAVRDKDTGRILFAGTIAETPSPWMFWHRVVPAGVIDLPPKYTVERLPEPKRCDCAEAGKWGATGRMPAGHYWYWRSKGNGYLAHGELPPEEARDGT